MDIKIITFYTFKDWDRNNIPKFLSDAIGINTGHSDKTTLSVKEPLRSVSNEVKDRIVIKDGRWMVERNCGEIILDGSSDENWYIYIFK